MTLKSIKQRTLKIYSFNKHKSQNKQSVITTHNQLKLIPLHTTTHIQPKHQQNKANYQKKLEPFR